MSKPVLTTKQVQQWREKGFVVVDGLADVSGGASYMNTRAEATPYDKATHTFGNDGALEFPCAVPELDTVPLQRPYLQAAALLLGVPHVVLHQAVAWMKYGDPQACGAYDANRPPSNSDQRLHQDYGNNTWVVPNWERPQAVAAIVYYSDLQDTGGATALVPREHGAYDEMYDTNTELNLRSPGLCGIPYVNNKQEAETLMSRVDEGAHLARQRAYNREVHIDTATVGTVLFYRLDVWHRGTPVHVGKVRCIHNIVWKRPDAFAYGMSTNWNSGFSNKLYNGWLETFVASLQYEQLLAIGFPPRESPYWTSRTVATVQKRYGGMDLRCFLPRTTSRL